MMFAISDMKLMPLMPKTLHLEWRWDFGSMTPTKRISVRKKFSRLKVRKSELLSSL
jgi:hypothetical protein